MARILALVVLIGSAGVPNADAGAPAPLPDSYPAPFADERVAERWVMPDVRAVANIPGRAGTSRPTRLVVYATPNGSTIEQTLGFARSGDWRSDIQHVLAKVRRQRCERPDDAIGLVCIEPEGLSWPAWRKKHAEAAPGLAVQILNGVRGLCGAPQAEVVLTGHSGGGAFTWAVLDSGDAVPPGIGHFAWLDSNYSYSDESRHGDKLLAWLRGGVDRRVTILAYDDRRITLNGKAVIGPDGGTYRATARMLDRFAREVELSAGRSGPFATRSGMGGRLRSWVHDNPDNRILHTALVGEMNGLTAVLDPAREPSPPRGYSRFIEPAPNIPDRPPGAPGGTAFLESVAALPPAAREEAVAGEILRGNIPEFLRKFSSVEVRGADNRGKPRTIDLDVMPDYLAIGSDADWVRIPMEPATAQRIATAFGCTLPTRKMVDHIWQAAGVRLTPIPLARDRESVASFLEHHRKTQEQRVGRPAGELCAGAKKDIVVTNRLSEKPNRVAIYGWHQPDGQPIQPLSIVHVNRYVDYSHGVRLVRRAVRVDGQTRDIRHVLQAPELHELLSDEGPLLRPSY